MVYKSSKNSPFFEKILKNFIKSIYEKNLKKDKPGRNKVKVKNQYWSQRMSLNETMAKKPRNNNVDKCLQKRKN